MKKLIDMWRSASIATKQRTVIFFITWVFSVYAMINSLVQNGFDSTTIQSLAATIVSGIASVANWWKNNSFTPAAIEADIYLNSLNETIAEEVIEDDIITEEEGLEEE